MTNFIWRYPKTLWKESSVVKWSKPGNCENKPKNVKVSKNIKRWNSHTFLIKAVSIKITYIMHIWQVHECINQFLSYFLHTFLKEFSQILIWVEMDRRITGYTFFGDSWMEKPVNTYILWAFQWNKMIIYLFQKKKN